MKVSVIVRIRRKRQIRIAATATAVPQHHTTTTDDQRTRAGRLKRRRVAALMSRTFLVAAAALIGHHDSTTANHRRADGQLRVVAVGRLKFVDAFARRVDRATARRHRCFVLVFAARILQLAFEQEKVDDFLCVVFLV